MKLLKAFALILINAIVALAFGTGVEMATGYDAITVASITFAAPPAIYIVARASYAIMDIEFPTLQRAPGLAMAVQTELWVDYIINNLFKENQFLNFADDDGAYVLNGSVVHIPQAGAKPTVVKNRTVFPGVAVRRTDTDVTYPLDVFSTDPTHIPKADTMEISYDKQESVLGEHRLTIGESIADEILYKWVNGLAATHILRTTGTATANSLAPGATGNRKALLKADLKRAQTLMNKNKVLKTDRFALLPTDLFSELMDDSDLMKRDGAQGGELDMKDGKIMRLYGFTIMERSETTIFDNAGTPAAKAPGAATAISDNQAVICWQKNAVTKTLGAVDFFEDTNNPLYYGDVYSAQVKAGGRRKRNDAHGVVVIVQEP